MPRSILLVEDNPNDLELSLLAFERSGVKNVVSVRDGAQALAYLDRKEEFANRDTENPALVILDMKLPKIDGLEVLRKVRCELKILDMPVVMFSTSNFKPDIERCYELGANAYVIKPLEFGDLVRTVGRIGKFWTHVNRVAALR